MKNKGYDAALTKFYDKQRCFYKRKTILKFEFEKKNNKLAPSITKYTYEKNNHSFTFRSHFIIAG